MGTITKPPFTACVVIWSADDVSTTAQKEGRVVPFGRCQFERVDQLRDLVLGVVYSSRNRSFTEVEITATPERGQTRTVPISEKRAREIHQDQVHRLG